VVVVLPLLRGRLVRREVLAPALGELRLDLQARKRARGPGRANGGGWGVVAYSKSSAALQCGMQVPTPQASLRCCPDGR
jgi:hypothetical protein